MSQKNRIIRPVIPYAKKKKGNPTKIKDIDLDILKDSNQEESFEEEKPKMKRLKKIKNQQSSEDEEYIAER